MMNIFKRFLREEETPQFDAQQMQEYQDGFATTYPLIGQPKYPTHKSAAYRRGLQMGKLVTGLHGLPTVPYEPAERGE